MCGLAGRFHPAQLPDAGDWYRRADRLLRHRGPDGRGHFRDEQCELVHRRLAILDRTPGGAQPMSSVDGAVQVVFNGEIYNHRSLRRTLECCGHRFRSRSDTEVLLRMYLQFGEEMVERLRGMFAFAVYDRRRRRLLLARDRFGIKPLFYTSAGPDGQWIFASELKAICAMPGFTPGIDRQACFDFLGTGFIAEPATGFAGIQALLPGTVLVVGANGQRVRRYYRPRVRPTGAFQLRQAADVCASRLADAVAGQGHADVPVGALLSGGIDSSLVVAARSRAAPGATSTFSVRFPDRAHDESSLAGAVAAHCGTDHHVIDAADRSLSPDDVLDLMRHFDQPFADTSFLPTYWVSRGVRDQGYVCALSGDGGDEAFGGYARFWRMHRIAQLMRAPSWTRRAAGRVGDLLAPRSRNWGRRLAKAARLADAGAADAAGLLAGLNSYLDEREKAALVHPDARDGLLPGHHVFHQLGLGGERTDRIDALSVRLTEALFAVSLPSDMLRKVDMMSMRAGIEVRVPLLDEALVEFGLQLPHALKTDGRQGKLVLRALASRWLPDRVVHHPKHGFTIPLDTMVPGAFHEAVEGLLCGPEARTRAFLDPAMVGQWLAAFRAARTNGASGGTMSRGGLYQRVFMVLALELWMRHHELSW